jgi:hypothetical protein
MIEKGWRVLATFFLAALMLVDLPAAEGKTTGKQELKEVTVYDYVRAETDEQFRGYAKLGGFGTFHHSKEPYDIDKQVTIRANRDTLYSFGVFDLDAGPLTIILPETDGRYMSMLMINEDHYMKPVMYAPGKFTFTKKDVRTRYVFFIVRTFADPNSKEDLEKAWALQEKIVSEQKSPGKLELPNWNVKELVKLRQAINVLGATVKDSSKLFGWYGEIDPISHCIGAALGWGGLPSQAALYLNVFPKKNDGKTPYILKVPKEVPVDGFWSISVYNKDGFFEKNRYNAYSLNNVTAKKNPDGSVTIRFGGDPKAPNYLPITPGWNYIVRLYRPRPELLEGKWKFPEAVPVAKP